MGGSRQTASGQGLDQRRGRGSLSGSGSAPACTGGVHRSTTASQAPAGSPLPRPALEPDGQPLSGRAGATKSAAIRQRGGQLFSCSRQSFHAERRPDRARPSQPRSGGDEHGAGLFLQCPRPAGREQPPYPHRPPQVRDRQDLPADRQPQPGAKLPERRTPVP